MKGCGALEIPSCSRPALHPCAWFGVRFWWCPRSVVWSGGNSSWNAVPVYGPAPLPPSQGGPNFLFVNKGNGSGQFVESAADYG